jgi:hypothetical protein
LFVRRALIAVCAWGVLLVPRPGLAQQIESTPVPEQPKPNFSSMNFLIGTWSCSNRSSRRPAPFTTTVTYTASPDGWWIDQKSVNKPMQWFPHSLTVYDKITYDATTKRWIDVSYGDNGTYGLSTAEGWNGDSIVWHDPTFAPSSDISAQTDTTMTKDSDTKYTSSNSFTEASNGRNVSFVTTCMKNG